MESAAAEITKDSAVTAGSASEFNFDKSLCICVFIILNLRVAVGQIGEAREPETEKVDRGGKYNVVRNSSFLFYDVEFKCCRYR